MSQNTFSSFALLGAGTLGVPLAKAKNGATVIVMTRPSSKVRKIPAGAVHVPVDFKDVPSLTEHFRRFKCDVVICAVNHEHLEVQPPTLEAANNAGVKLYVPSEFGIPSEGQDGILAKKSEFVDLLRATGMPYTRLYAGILMDFIPFVLGIDWDGQATLIGEGNTPASFTALDDVAGYLSYVLTHLPPEELSNRTLRIEGERLTLLQIVELYGDNVKLARASRLPDEMDNPRLREFLQAKVETGAATATYNIKTGKDDQKLDNELWPDHRWQPVVRTLGL
ncbi:hypothetical protein BU15DRAFT_69863 [Melanogaster broomeanus]|nr:hypothetical protein BU15DRAFT_69863 [Melanogaster broomeanus]